MAEKRKYLYRPADSDESFDFEIIISKGDGSLAVSYEGCQVEITTRASGGGYRVVPKGSFSLSSMVVDEPDEAIEIACDIIWEKLLPAKRAENRAFKELNELLNKS